MNRYVCGRWGWADSVWGRVKKKEEKEHHNRSGHLYYCLIKNHQSNINNTSWNNVAHMFAFTVGFPARSIKLRQVYSVLGYVQALFLFIVHITLTFWVLWATARTGGNTLRQRRYSLGAVKCFVMCFNDYRWDCNVTGSFLWLWVWALCP